MNKNPASEKLIEPEIRRPGEPLLWHERFLRYLHTGPERKLVDCFPEGKNKPQRIGPPTSSAAKKWKWKERAMQWDARTALQQSAQIVSPRERLQSNSDEILAHFTDIALKVCKCKTPEEVKALKLEAEQISVLAGKSSVVGLMIDANRMAFGDKKKIMGSGGGGDLWPNDKEAIARFAEMSVAAKKTEREGES